MTNPTTLEASAAGWPDRTHPLDSSGALPQSRATDAQPLPTEAVSTVPIGANTTNALSNLTCTSNSLSFNYVLSDNPNYQWWALYYGNMRDYAYWGKYQAWNWFYNTSSSETSGRVTTSFDFTSGVIYTLAMYKDPTKDSYHLSDYIEFRAP